MSYRFDVRRKVSKGVGLAGVFLVRRVVRRFPTRAAPDGPSGPDRSAGCYAESAMPGLLTTSNRSRCRRGGGRLCALAFVLAACTASDDLGPHPHDHPGVSGRHYEKNPSVALAREYWIISVDTDRGTRAMLPRPDGDRRIVRECEANGPLAAFFRSAALCASASSTEAVERINALTRDQALRISTFLHEKLYFVSEDRGEEGLPQAADVNPHPLTSDILDVCKTFESDRAGALRELCDYEQERQASGGGGHMARGMSTDEARALAARLNELYGIAEPPGP
jgi:hypothetical protein